MNSENRNLYSISDLADQVGVPRTTITDWLGKYARFIELQTQGRRRFYTDRTLSVLCKVAELRTAGRSIGDIDGELERIFPVNPTVDPPESPEPPPASGPDAGADTDAAGTETAGPGQQTYPVMKQDNTDELYDLLGTKFSDLCDAMNAVNRKADTSARRLRLMLAVAVMIIVVLAGFLALFYINFLVQRDNTAASRNAASAIAEFTAGSETRENALRADVGGLAGSMSGMEGRVSGMNDEIQKIRADLPAQRAAFEAAIEELKRNTGSTIEAQKAQFDAQIALEKEQFAAERLKLLQQISSLQERLNQATANEPARDEELRKLRDELTAQNERDKDVNKLRAELAVQTERAREVDKLRAELAVQTERGKNVEKLSGELDVVSGRLAELRDKNQALKDELAAANKRAEAEAEARKKAEAEAENARRAAAVRYSPPPPQSAWRPGAQ